jgi:AraC-like DNA-binding protein
VRVIHRFSTDRLTVSDVLRAAAEASLSIEPANNVAINLQTPAMSGRLLTYQVHGGLTASAHDITYLSDQEFVVDVEPSLMCGVLLQGDDDVMWVDGHDSVSRRRERPVLVGFAETTKCRRPFRAQHRCCGAGFALSPSFFDRFGEQIADDGLSMLRNFCRGGFRTETLARSPRLLEIAREALDHSYNGALGELFLECNALSFVLEVAKLLEHERRMVTEIGRGHYDRVMEAREFLDANLTTPPRALELARRVGTNITTLQANFKLVVGTTVFGYVREQRLLMARVLLREHDVSVAEAGYRVGFSSPAAFTAAYRRSFGHPPSAEMR